MIVLVVNTQGTWHDDRSARSIVWDAALEGARDIAPFLLGLLPFGLAIGAAVAASPVDDVVGWATAPALFSGGVQLTTVELLGAGASLVTILVSVLVLTARFAVYGATLAPTLEGQPRWFCWLAPYFVVEPVVAVASEPAAQRRSTIERRWHYLGAASALWLMWCGSAAAGVVAGLPRDLALDFAAPLCLLALLARRMRGGGSRLAALVGGAAALLVVVVPTGVAVAVAIVAGSAVGAVARGSAR
jgi:predicted branched-subunit amino acid permease